ncbi:MAG TPA: hypothetical protein PLC12_01980 [Candidatus Methanofastidiosa archaeon]|nr:hypothetical protein [Candidatus Methanofastidiosa archaeon]
MLPMQLSAEEVGNEVFLKGDNIELGIHEAGSFGSANEAPVGYNPSCPEYLGQIGFATNGMDYFLPGTPFEGWTLEWTFDTVEYSFMNYGLCTDYGYEGYPLTYGVPMTSNTDTSVGDVMSSEWVGTATSGDMAVTVTQVATMNKDDRFFTIEITLENTGTVPLSSVEYLRTVDPDNEQVVTGNFYTGNYVISSPYSVHAVGLRYGAELTLTPITPGGKVDVSPDWSLDPDDYLDYTYANVGDYIVGDYAIGAAYRFDTLGVGEDVTFSFSYSLPYISISENNSPSPFVTMKPLVLTLMDRAVDQWECISSALPEELTDEAAEMVSQVETCMARATSLTNTVTVVGSLTMACNVMEELNELLSCGCVIQ